MSDTIVTAPKKKVCRRGAGRTKGSFSFTPVSLKALNAKFADKETQILMSRKQAESYGFQNLITDRISELKESISGQTTETKVLVKIEEF